MLGLSVVVRYELNKRAVVRVGLRTVDVGAHRKGRVVGESFCSVVIGTVDVCVILKCGKYRRRGYMRTLTLVKTLYSQFSVVSGTAMLRSRVVGSLEPAEPNDHHAKGNRFLGQTLHLELSFRSITLQHQVGVTGHCR
jgi:hypothetical protein